MGFTDEEGNSPLDIPITEPTLRQMLSFIKKSQEYDALEASIREQERRGEILANREPDSWVAYRKKTYGK